MTTTTIEMVTYKLKADSSVTQLQATHNEINAFCLSQPGFLYRSISQDESNTWYDIVYWQNMDNAKAAGEAFMATEVCHSLQKIIDGESVTMRHMLAVTEAMADMAAAA